MSEPVKVSAPTTAIGETFWKEIGDLPTRERPIFQKVILESSQLPTVLITLILTYLEDQRWELSTLDVPQVNLWTWTVSKRWGQVITVRPEALTLRSVEFRVGQRDGHSCELDFLLQEWNGVKLIGNQLYRSPTKRMSDLGLQKWELNERLKPNVKYLLMLERIGGHVLVEPCSIDEKFHRTEEQRGVHSLENTSGFTWSNLGGGCLAFRAVFCA